MEFDYRKDSVLDASYDLNPEIIESAYYLYSRTGDQTYRQRAERYFDDIETYCRTDEAYASIKDVRTKEKADELPSFFFAETMKYLYLTFAHVAHFGYSQVIFSTEAHPFQTSLFSDRGLRKRLGY